MTFRLQYFIFKFTDKPERESEQLTANSDPNIYMEKSCTDFLRSVRFSPSCVLVAATRPWWGGHAGRRLTEECLQC